MVTFVLTFVLTHFLLKLEVRFGTFNKTCSLQGWGIDVMTPNTTIYENMGEFVLSCKIQNNGDLKGKHNLSKLFNVARERILNDAGKRTVIGLCRTRPHVA